MTNPGVPASWTAGPGRPAGQAQPIGQVMPQQRVVVRGEIRGFTAMALRGCPACRYELSDGTGELDLMFLGRLEVRGLEKGRRCTAAGTAATRDDRIVLWNPRYELEPRDTDDSDGSGSAAPVEAAPESAIAQTACVTATG
jgi:hypothetical protein